MMPLQGLEEPQLQQQQMHMRQLAQQTRGPWVKYHIQRITTHINHVLFYVVDPAGNARLAVVVRQWGDLLAQQRNSQAAA